MNLFEKKPIPPERALVAIPAHGRHAVVLFARGPCIERAIDDAGILLEDLGIAIPKDRKDEKGLFVLELQPWFGGGSWEYGDLDAELNLDNKTVWRRPNPMEWSFIMTGGMASPALWPEIQSLKEEEKAAVAAEGALAAAEKALEEPPAKESEEMRRSRLMDHDCGSRP